MPTIKKRKPGYHPKAYSELKGRSSFTDEKVAELAERYGYPNPANLEALREALDSAAAVYWVNKDIEENAPRRGNIVTTVKDIQGLATKLRQRLSELDLYTAHLIAKLESEVHYEAAKVAQGDGQQPSRTRFGHKIQKTPQSDGTNVISYLDLDDIAEGLNILQSYCQTIRDSLPADKPGPREKHALKLWVDSMSRIWTDQFGQPFTLNFDEEQPLSEAARFCKDALEILDASVFWTSLIAQMRLYTSTPPSNPTE